jgi:tartrate dehydratase beta subunit/fumarate hydratase class I family protein
LDEATEKKTNEEMKIERLKTGADLTLAGKMVEGRKPATSRLLRLLSPSIGATMGLKRRSS